MNNRLRISLAAFALASLAVDASAVPLSTLIANNQSLTIGDKTFAGFGISGYNASVIDVSASVSAGVYYLMFEGRLVNSGGTTQNPNDPMTIQLSYTIETTSGLPLITSIDQSFGLIAEGTPGEVNITETVRIGSFTGAQVGRSMVGITLGGAFDDEDPAAEPGDVLALLAPQSKLFVSTSVFLNALPNGVVGASSLSQSFHQTTIPGGGVPDGGSSLLLLGGAICGIGLIRKLRLA